MDEFAEVAELRVSEMFGEAHPSSQDFAAVAAAVRNFSKRDWQPVVNAQYFYDKIQACGPRHLT